MVTGSNKNLFPEITILALEESEIYEFSTQHFESDSYRLIKGD